MHQRNVLYISVVSLCIAAASLFAELGPPKLGAERLWVGSVLSGLTALFLLLGVIGGVIWVRPYVGGFLRWVRPRIRHYLWLVGGPVLFGLLLGGMEWWFSNSLRNALWIGLSAFALALLGFVVWAIRLVQSRQQVQILTAEELRIKDQNRQLRETNESYEDTFRKKEEAHHSRLGLLYELGQLREEGGRIKRSDHNRYDFEDWKERVRKLIELALDPSERRNFFRVPADYAKYSDDVDESEPSERIETQYILNQIEKVMSRLNTYHLRYEVRADFHIRVYRRWLETR
jgi:hypothetical protein